MRPLTVSREGLRLALSWVTEVVDEARAAGGDDLHVTIGTMVETPRAAVHAAALAEVADFFSFGTNDLTQMVFGFSRDAVESHPMPVDLATGLLRTTPLNNITRTAPGKH